MLNIPFLAAEVTREKLSQTRLVEVEMRRDFPIAVETRVAKDLASLLLVQKELLLVVQILLLAFRVEQYVLLQIGDDLCPRSQN